jgi:uncharacterized repeat protein (TIGR01451 family)
MKRNLTMNATSAGRSLRVLVTSAMLFAVLIVTIVVISPSEALAAKSVRHGDAKDLFYTAGSAADLATVVYPPRGHAPAARPPYSTAIFTVIVTNNGPNTAANVAVTNTVAGASLAAITATPSTVSCSVSTGSCTEPQLQSGASITIKVFVHYKEFWHNMFFDDRATATSPTPDPNTANNSALGIYVI